MARPKKESTSKLNSDEIGKGDIPVSGKVDNGKEDGVKYRVDFDSWEEYHKYKGKKG